MNVGEARRAVCEFCHCRCRVLVHVEDGNLVKFEEDPDDPRGSTLPRVPGCLRLRGAQEWMYYPDRLNYPLKRVGERGEGGWMQLPWNQALDEIAEKLLRIKGKYGAEAISLVTGTYRTRGDLQSRFCHLLGTPNYGGQSRICWAPNIVLSAALSGWPHRTYVGVQPGVEAVTKCILLAGFNPAQSMARLWGSIREAKKLGARLIVIDPRRTEVAELADLWLQVRPGTDVVLFMAMVNVIIREKLYDKEFVTKWCYGFDRLTERVKTYPPGKAAEITGVRPGKIREAAVMFATNKPALSLHGMGIEHHPNCVAAIHARLILQAITGNIDIEGGAYMSGPPACIAEPELEFSEKLSPEQKGKQLGSDRFKLLSWVGYQLILENVLKAWGKPFQYARSAAHQQLPTTFRAAITGKPYPVKAVMTIGANPLVTCANTKLVYKALKSLELLVVQDFFLTPSAEIADYVLPVASWLERPFLSSMGGQDNVIIGGEQTLPAVVPGKYEHKTDEEILGELWRRIGPVEYWPWRNREELFDYQLKPLSMTFKQFMNKGGFYFPPNEYKKYERKGFATPTGKFELYSTILEKLGHDPLPRYEEPFESPVATPEVAKEYPLILISGGRFLPMFHSEHRQVESIRARHPYPLVQINPKTAQELDINNGDWAWIETRRGRIRMKVKLFEGIDPGVVHCEHGWWFPELPGEEPWLHGVWESNVNVLTEDDPDVCDKKGGGWPLKWALCKVYKTKVY
jgi:thiosulfate reductase/polysulfide reductase chain A